MSEFVYLARSGDTTKYKIGRTNDLASRLKTLNGKQSADEILYVFSIEVIDSKSIEKTLQNKYKKYHHWNEWFNLTDEQVENVIQDMNFLQFNEQILYSTEDSSYIDNRKINDDQRQFSKQLSYSHRNKNNTDKREKIDPIQIDLKAYIEGLNIYTRNEMYYRNKILLTEVCGIIQIAFLKKFINGQNYLDVGINFFLEKDYKSALLCFDIAIAVDKNTHNGVAFYWKGESCLHLLNIKKLSRVDKEELHTIVLDPYTLWVSECYENYIRWAYDNYNQIQSIESESNLARAYHVCGLFEFDYMGGKDSGSLPFLKRAKDIYGKLNYLNTRNIIDYDIQIRLKQW